MEPKVAQLPFWLPVTTGVAVEVSLAMLELSKHGTGCMQAHLRRTRRRSLLKRQSLLPQSLQRRAVSRRGTHLLLL